MKKITRQEFLDICLAAITKVRKKITILNQLSGYKKFHKENRDNSYIDTLRNSLNELGMLDLVVDYYVIKSAGVGLCDELTNATIFQLAKKINASGARARIYKVGTSDGAPLPHTFIRVEIKLKGESDCSYWELDSWDPRIIDISTQKDGEFKNSNFLRYGTNVQVDCYFDTHTLDYSKHTFFNIQKPKEGIPSRSPTPEKEVLSKRRGQIHPDHSIEEALTKKMICPNGQNPGPLQDVSFWQQAQHENVLTSENQF